MMSETFELNPISFMNGSCHRNLVDIKQSTPLKVTAVTHHGLIVLNIHMAYSSKHW